MFHNVTGWSIFIMPECTFTENILQWKTKRNHGKGLLEVSKANEILCIMKHCLRL